MNTPGLPPSNSGSVSASKLDYVVKLEKDLARVLKKMKNLNKLNTKMKQ
jgi:hypothetical protein